MTIFCCVFVISCNFCIFHRNRFISFMPMKSQYVFTQQIKEMAKICFNTLKIIVVKYGEISFPWRNMVLCSTSSWVRVNPRYSFWRSNVTLLSPEFTVWYALSKLTLSGYITTWLKIGQKCELVSPVTGRTWACTCLQKWSHAVTLPLKLKSSSSIHFHHT